MGSTDEFCLRWNDFEANISSAFRHLRNDPDFFDVSLACRIDSGGEASDQHRTLKAHKVILSSCSPYFRSLLREQAKSLGNAGNGVQTQIPYIVMRGVSYNQLSGILDFMYYGEANVAQEELDSFLALAEELQVKGLTQSKGNGSSTSDPAAERGQQQPTASGKKRPPPPPAAANAGSVKKLKQAAAASSRSRSPTPSAGSGSNFQGIKTESTDAPFGGGGGSGGASAAAAASEEASGNDNDGYYDSFGQDESRSYDDPGEGTSGFNEDDKGQYEEYQQQQEQQESAVGEGMQMSEEDYQARVRSLITTASSGSGFMCKICNQSARRMTVIRTHVECIHLMLSRYECQFCRKRYHSKVTLTSHIHANHKEQHMLEKSFGDKISVNKFYQQQ